VSGKKRDRYSRRRWRKGKVPRRWRPWLKPAGGYAFGAREGAYVLGIESNWIDEQDDEAKIAWARKVYAAAEPFSTGERYLNFPGFFEEGQDLARAAAGSNFDRLLSIKKQYDPTGLFRSSAE
jgi:hypothetical protein